jgi:uncharacterized protein YwqG
MDDLAPAARRLITETLSPAAAEILLREVRPAVALSHAPTPMAGVTRLGGRPLLDQGTDWPEWHETPLSLIALVDLAEFRTMSAGTGLPLEGLLNLFYEVEDQRWGFDPADRGAWRVVPANPVTAEPRDAPAGATAYPQIALAGRRVATYPDWQEDVLDAIPGEVGERYDDLIEDLEAEHAAGPRHQLGGWPLLQQAPWQLECHLASSGIDVGGPEGYEGPRVDALRAGVADWVMLAQIDTDDDAGWMWGDVGMLYFAIRREDLSAHAWERAWMVLQCG